MNLAGGEEETKTIKYLNNSGSEQEQHSESATEKQFQQELLLARKIFHTSKSKSKEIVDSVPPNCKIVFIQTLGKYEYPRNQPHPPPPISKNKHKKGKSMDLEELVTSSRDDKKLLAKLEGSKEKVKRNQNKGVNIDLKERKSISEMKHYQYGSTKLGSYKGDVESSHNFKKKKSKSNQSGELKHLKKQIKKFIDETPIYIQRKKDSSRESYRTQKHHTIHMNSKNVKTYSKSEEIFSEGRFKKKPHVKQRQGQQLRQVSFSMPMTSKIINLLSSSSSVYNSQKELQPVNRDKSFVIPTEESIDEINQIRLYQHTVLRKSSSDKFRHARKATPINQLLQEQVDESKDSTSNIINYYIRKFQQAASELNQDIQELSYIPNQNSLKGVQINIPSSDIMLESLNFPELEDISQCQSIKLDNSVVVQSNAIKQQEEELKKLDGIIDQISKKGDRLQKSQKQVILSKIKLLITGSSNIIANQQSPSNKSIQDSSNIQLSNSELKQSFGFQKDMSQLNLQMLDKALRERENYLIQRKEKEIQKLEELYDNSDLSQEKEKIIKWIDHQIRSVVHTRHQLWKGFNIAKEYLEARDESQSNKKKKGDMMKCLSEKYLQKQDNPTNLTKKKKKVAQKQEKRQKAQGSQSDTEQLGQGRISELKSQINSHVQQDEQEQLLLSQTKAPDCEGKVGQNKAEFGALESSSDSEYDYKKDNILNQPLKEAEPINHDKVQVAETTGLCLKQIQCDIEYEDSFNQQDLEKLARQSQKLKQQSMKIPFNLSMEDKEDIYQFIFLDLCVQLTDQYSLSSPIVQKIFTFIKNMKEQSRRQKGFKTNTNVIKQYLFQFISFLKSKSDLLSEVYDNLDKPLGPTAIDILKYMHVCDDDPPDDESNDTVFILDIKLFQKFEQEYLGKLQFETYYEDEEKQKRRRAFLKNAIHIHNKAIFDALNQTLDKQRPFGVWGEPFSWKKIAKFYHQRDVPAKNSILLKSAQKTIEYGAYMCGFMIDKQQCTLKSNPNISQGYIDQIRDDRLSRMLANDLDEAQEKMLFIDDEETEILVEVGHQIYQSLVEELCKEYIRFH